jgi:hypothetical protein
MKKSQVQNLSGGRKVKNRCGPSDYGNTPNTRHTKDTLWAVEEAVDTRVSEVLRWRVEEEVTAEPSEFAERVVNAGCSPQV